MALGTRLRCAQGPCKVSAGSEAGGEQDRRTTGTTAAVYGYGKGGLLEDGELAVQTQVRQSGQPESDQVRAVIVCAATEKSDGSPRGMTRAVLTNEARIR